MKWAPSVRWSRRTAEMGLPCHCNGHLLLAFLKELLLLIVTLMVTPGPKALPHLSDVVSQCFRLTLIFSLFFSIYCFSPLSLPPSFLYASALPVWWISAYHMHAWYPQRPEEGMGSPDTRVRDDCEGVVMWVLRIEPGSSARADNALNVWKYLFSPSCSSSMCFV